MKYLPLILVVFLVSAYYVSSHGNGAGSKQKKYQTAFPSNNNLLVGGAKNNAGAAELSVPNPFSSNDGTTNSKDSNEQVIEFVYFYQDGGADYVIEEEKGLRDEFNNILSSDYNGYSFETLRVLSELDDNIAKGVLASKLVNVDHLESSGDSLERAFSLALAASFAGDVLAVVVVSEILLQKNKPSIGYAVLDNFKRNNEQSMIVNRTLSQYYLRANYKSKNKIIEEAKYYSDWFLAPNRLARFQQEIFSQSGVPRDSGSKE